MSDNIHDISVYENVVYLYYDITITEQEQLDINLSKIKDNILKYKTQFDNNAVQFYYDKDYKKVTVFIEYCDAGCNPKKHQSKEFHELNSKKETEALARWLKKRGYFDEKNSDDIRKNTVSR